MIVRNCVLVYGVSGCGAEKGGFYLFSPASLILYSFSLPLLSTVWRESKAVVLYGCSFAVGC